MDTVAKIPKSWTETMPQNMNMKIAENPLDERSRFELFSYIESHPHSISLRHERGPSIGPPRELIYVPCCVVKD